MSGHGQAPQAHPLRVPLLRLPHGADLPLPHYASAGAAGLDIPAAIAADDKITLRMGERALVATGFALQLPIGYEAQVRSRSGLAIRHGITVLQGIGTVDADFRGEVMVALINLGQHPFDIVRGMRIAQLVVAPVTPVAWVEVADLSPSERGGGGFGSTGSTGRGAYPGRD